MNHEVPDNGSFKRVFIANRGEIAIRIAKAATTLGMESVGVHVPMDAGSLHTRYTTENREIGSSAGDQADPVNAYLDIDALVNAAKATGCDCVHPGYGFLSENVEFASRCEVEGITFVGPTTDALNLFGDKVQARALAKSIGVSVVDGSDESVDSSATAKELARNIGYPVMLKAAAGGGGRGMRLVETEAELSLIHI